MSDWHIIQETPDETIEIRTWEPGDGLLCAAAGMHTRTPCGTPVAVKRTKDEVGFYSSPRHQTRVRVRHRVICDKHLAEAVRELTSESRNNINFEAEKMAREYILAKNWDEYQAKFHANIDAIKDAELGKLPKSLRRMIQASGS